jgi:ComF family protein
MNPVGSFKAQSVVNHALWKAVDWIFPPTCGGCDVLGVRWCAACQAQVEALTGPICPCCGDPVADGGLCVNCRTQPPAFQALRSYGIFRGPLRNAIHRLKYQKDIGLGEPLSKPLIELYNDLQWGIDVIIPVPLSERRNRERGYNQSGVLSKWLAFDIQKPVVSSALKRTRNTRPQVGLSAEERRHNVEGAFVADPAHVKGKRILLIDDVTTTGSTISACAQTLQTAGASAVFGLTLARAVLQADADDLPTPFSLTEVKNGSRGFDLPQKYGFNRSDQRVRQ